MKLPVSGEAYKFLPKSGLLDQLARKQLFAVRRGILKFRGFKPIKIPVSSATLTDADLSQSDALSNFGRVTIELISPALEALIHERLNNGHFHDVNELLSEALLTLPKDAVSAHLKKDHGQSLVDAPLRSGLELELNTESLTSTFREEDGVPILRTGQPIDVRAISETIDLVRRERDREVVEVF